MTSISTLSTTAPFRLAVRPQSYLHLAVRSYSGLAATHHARNLASSPIYTPKRRIHSTPQNQIKEYFPPPEVKGVEVDSAWQHPV